MSIIFKQFSVSNNSDLSGMYGFLSSDTNTCIRNSYINNGTGIANLTNNSKCYTLNCNSKFNFIKEKVVINNNTTVGNISPIDVEKDYETQQLSGYGINCTLSKNSSFSTDDNMNNVYQETICEIGSLYNFPNLDNTIPLISIMNKNNVLLSNYFKKDQLYGDYNINTTYNYGTIIYYSNMYFICKKNDTKNITPGGSITSYDYWGPYSVYDDKIYSVWSPNKNYNVDDIVYCDYSFYKCLSNHVNVYPTQNGLSSINPNSYWIKYDSDKQLLNYKYTDFSDLIITNEWNQHHNYRYGDVVRFGNKHYKCINNTGVIIGNINITDQMYWSVDNRYNDTFKNIYKRYDNIFVNDGNINKFTNKSFLTKNLTFEVHNLLDIEILQNFVPKNLNGFKLTIEFYGQDMYNYINNNIIIYAPETTDVGSYFISSNNRSGYDPTNEKMLKYPIVDESNTNNPYSDTNYSYANKPPLIKTNDMIGGEYSSRPVISKVNISGLYNGNVDIVFVDNEKTIYRKLNGLDDNTTIYTESNGQVVWNNNDKTNMCFVDNIPCSFTFKDISGKLNIVGKNSSLSTKTNIVLNSLKSDGYIFKFVNCENVEITNLQLMMSYSNVFGIVADNVVTPNDCYEAFVMFDNSKAYINQCNYMFLYYKYSDNKNFVNETYQTVWTIDGKNRSNYIFNHNFAGLDLGLNNSQSETYNATYIVEGLISCENNSQCLIENDEKPTVFTNFNRSGNNKSYISLLSNSQVTWLAIGLFDTPVIRETMIEYLVNHIEVDSIKRYKNKTLSINSADFMNGVGSGGVTYPAESLSRTILKSAVWKRILNKYKSIRNVDNQSSPLTPQMLYVFLKLWCDNDLIEVSPVNINNNYYFNNNDYLDKDGIIHVYNSDNNNYHNNTNIYDINNTISDMIYNKNINYDIGYNITKGQFKAAKILIDLLKTVEQSLNFDIKTDSDKSVSSYDTTTATGTYAEYKKTNVVVNTTILDSLKNLINLITFENIVTVDNRLIKYLLNTCEYEENTNLKPISLINGAFETFKTILTQLCVNLNIPSPTFDLSNVIDIENNTNGEDITCSDMTINFVGKKKELDVVGNKIVSNFNNNIFYPSDETYFYDQVYIPENNSELDSPITDFSYEQTWTMGVTLLGDSRGSSSVQVGGIWGDNTYIEMTYEPLQETILPITDDTQCVIKIHFIAPKVLFNWMEFFTSIDKLNWTCKTFMGVVGSLLTLFGEGRGDDGFWIGFKDGYPNAYNINNTNNLFYLIWYYLYNPTSEINTSQSTLQMAEQLYVINQLLSVNASTLSGLLNHYHLLPQRLSQNSGIPIGSVCISWRSYLADLVTYNFPRTFNSSKVVDLSTQLDSEWVWCDGRTVYDGDINLTNKLLSKLGNNTPNLGLVDYTFYKPFVNCSISGFAGMCPGNGNGSSTVKTYSAATTEGPVLSFTHSSTRRASKVNYNFILNFGWIRGYSGFNNRYGLFTNSFKPLLDQLKYKVGCWVDGKLMVANDGCDYISDSVSNNNSDNTSVHISNFGLYDQKNNRVSSFFNYLPPYPISSDEDPKFGGRYSVIPETRHIQSMCDCNMCDIITEILYVMKISGSVTTQTNMVRMLRSVGYKSTLVTQNQINSQNIISTPNVYYDNNGVVRNISFVGYDNIMSYNVTHLSKEQFESNDWIYNNILLEQHINDDLYTSTLYKYTNNILYISSELVKKYIQMKIVEYDQRISALYNSNEDHHYGYKIILNDKQYCNIPVDIIINSSGIGSNDLSLLDLSDEVYQQIELLNRNSIEFNNNELFISSSLSNLNYSELLKCDIDSLKYYQYIELDHLTPSSRNKLIDLFGVDYYNTASSLQIGETINVELNYVTENRVVFDIYNDANVKSNIFNRTISNSHFIVIYTSVNLNKNQFESFVNSLQEQRNNKYINRNINSPIEQYNSLLNKYELNDDISISTKTLIDIINDIEGVYNDI